MKDYKIAFLNKHEEGNVLKDYKVGDIIVLNDGRICEIRGTHWWNVEYYTKGIGKAGISTHYISRKANKVEEHNFLLKKFENETNYG